MISRQRVQINLTLLNNVKFSTLVPPDDAEFLSPTLGTTKSQMSRVCQLAGVDISDFKRIIGHISLVVVSLDRHKTSCTQCIAVCTLTGKESRRL